MFLESESTRLLSLLHSYNTTALHNIAYKRKTLGNMASPVPLCLIYLNAFCLPCSYHNIIVAFKKKTVFIIAL